MNDVVDDYKHAYMWHQIVWLAILSIVKSHDNNQVFIGDNSCGVTTKVLYTLSKVFTSTVVHRVAIRGSSPGVSPGEVSDSDHL